MTPRAPARLTDSSPHVRSGLFGDAGLCARSGRCACPASCLHMNGHFGRFSVRWMGVSESASEGEGPRSSSFMRLVSPAKRCVKVEAMSQIQSHRGRPETNADTNGYKRGAK